MDEVIYNLSTSVDNIKKSNAEQHSKALKTQEMIDNVFNRLKEENEYLLERFIIDWKCNR